MNARTRCGALLRSHAWLGGNAQWALAPCLLKAIAMPSIETLVTFFVVAVVLALTPGPDNIFVLVQSVQRGWRLGLAVVLGGVMRL